jgi:hypothetical protein
MVGSALIEHIHYLPPQFLQAYNTLYLGQNRNGKSRHNFREDQCVELLQKNEALTVALGAMFIEKSSFSNEGKHQVGVNMTKFPILEKY